MQQIEESTLELSAAIDRAERGIEFLHEYRTRLIADVVTGKLDVREVAARLPDEIEEQEALEETEADTDVDAAADGIDANPDEGGHDHRYQRTRS